MVKNSHNNWKESEYGIIESSVIYFFVFCMAILIFKFLVLTPIQKHFNNSQNKTAASIHQIIDKGVYINV